VTWERSRVADGVIASELVTNGVHRLGTEWVGWYLIVDETVTVVDCGFPGYHDQLPSALARLGLALDVVSAVVLTHYHSDHVGSAERIRSETGATIYVPEGDAEGVRTGKIPLPGGMASSLWRPRMMRYMAHAARNGGEKVRPVAQFSTYRDGEVLAGASGLRVIHTPGHTAGHCSLLAERAGVLFAGDALATFDFFSGRAGPRLVRFNEDARQARESLSRLESFDANVIAVGHGSPYRGSAAEAVAAACVAGG
jgi:glyoxylase-like metal-dependent hydrolase (beta-lactamase superfamily II)